MSSATRRPMVGVLLAGAILALALLAPAAQAKTKPDVTVMTRNIYLGSSLDPALGATDLNGFVAGVAQIYGTVQFTDFTTRAGALANEIAAAKPDLVGLQEVSIWDTAPVTGRATPPPGYEFLTILQAALNAKGLHYDVGSFASNADIGPAPLVTGNAPPACAIYSFSPFIPDCTVRLRDRDVILVNHDRADLSTSNPQSGRYTNQASAATPVGNLSFDRGWTSVDVSLSDTSFRFFNSHLETEAAPTVQQAQGGEALAIINASPVPVIAVGDYNSATNGSTTTTYANLLAGGLRDTWVDANGSTGNSCCQNSTLTNTTSAANERIDLVLTKGKWAAKAASLTGSTPFRTQGPARPIWASDHFGVAATLKQP